MEPSYFGTPYLTTTASNSRKIRDLLDKQEAEYSVWRRNRKPIRHAFASSKLNHSLLASLSSGDQNQSTSATPGKPLWLSLLERTPEERTPRPGSSSGSMLTPRPKSTASHRRSVAAPRRGSCIGMPGSSASTPTLPALDHSKVAHGVRDRLGTMGPLTRGSPVSGSPSKRPTWDPSLPPKRKKPSAAKRKLQKHLYDFHSTIVFSIGPQDQQPERRPTTAATPEARNRHVRHASEQEPDVVVIELPPPEQEQDDPYVVAGLPLVDALVFDQIFEFDWARTDVDRLVRDAVERKRIYLILKASYRVVMLYFTQYTGKSALDTKPLSHFGSLDLIQIPNRLSLLHDLTVPCVDPVKFGLTESPLRRDGLIAFLLQTARMVAAHPPYPIEFRLFAAEGIEISEAVKCLMRDHVLVYAQLQDANHFRDLFLLDHDHNDHHDSDGNNQGGERRRRRRLKHLLKKHEATVSSFFMEMIATTFASMQTGKPRGVRTNSLRAGTEKLPAPASVPVPIQEPSPMLSPPTAMSFQAFVVALKAIGVIPKTRVETRRPSVQVSKDTATTAAAAKDEGSSTTLPPGSTAMMMAMAAAVTLDESRAMRIFQQCLDISAETSGGSPSASKQQLAYPQFVEALLRVTLSRKETLICRGGFDICAGQQTSEVCLCKKQPPDYNFHAFDDAVEELFSLIQAHRSEHVRKRSVMKMTSLRGLQLHASGRQSGGRLHQRHRAIVVERDLESTGETM